MDLRKKVAWLLKTALTSIVYKMDSEIAVNYI